MSTSTTSTTSELVVVRADQKFLIDPAVAVFWQGRRIGSIRSGESVTVPVDSDGEATFSWAFRSAKAPVVAGERTQIELSWSRIWGTLRARRVAE